MLLHILYNVVNKHKRKIREWNRAVDTFMRKFDHGQILTTNDV